MMMFVFNLGLALIALVHGQSQFHNVPGIVAVEYNIESGQALSNLEELRHAIGIPDPFTLKVEERRDASNGLQRQKLSIWYDGVMVRVAKLQASVDDGFYTGAVSGYYPSNFPSSLDVSCERTESELKEALVGHINSKSEVPQFVNGGMVDDSLLDGFEFDKQIDIQDDGSPVLVYYVRATVDLPEPNEHGAYIIYPRALLRHSDLSDINFTVAVLLARQSRRACPKARGGNIAYPGHRYGRGRNKICLKAKRTGKTCEYSNDDVIVYTVNGSFDRDSAEVVSFKCRKGPGDEANGAFSPSSDVFYSSQVFFKMLKKWGKVRNPNPDPIKMFVHFGRGYPNSFFDGNHITFGDGTPLTYSVALPEVLGHEMCHYITHNFHNLQMNTETMALNEAFSDMCGKAVTVYDTGVNDWKFAKEFERDVDALRYFDQPSRDGFTIDHMDDFDSGLNQYSLMGIYLKFMYNVVAEQNIEFPEAFETMMFANQVYWNEETSLIDGACGVLRAASDLALDVNAFSTAFADVGIDLGFCSLSGTQDIISSQSCSGSIVRNPTVSSSRTPTYLVRAAQGVSHVHVRVQHVGASHVTVFSHVSGGDVVYHDSLNVDIPLGADDVIVGLSSNDSTMEVEVEFSFS